MRHLGKGVDVEFVHCLLHYLAVVVVVFFCTATKRVIFV